MAQNNNIWQQREASLKGDRQLAALDEIASDFENIHAAWEWALEQQNETAVSEMLNTLFLFCVMRNRGQEGVTLFQKARHQFTSSPDDKQHPIWGAVLCRMYLLDPDTVSKIEIERSLKIAEQHSNKIEIAYCTLCLAEMIFANEVYAEALSFYEESLHQFREADDKFNMAGVLHKMAESYRRLGNADQAIVYARQSLELSQETGDSFWFASSLANTGIIALYTGNYSESETYLLQANQRYRELGYQAGIASSNLALSKLVELRANWDEAQSLVEEAVSIATKIGMQDIIRAARYLPNPISAELNQTEKGTKDKKKVASAPPTPEKINNYEIIKQLWVDLKVVYHARHIDDGREVVLKVGLLKSPLGAGQNNIEMMLATARHEAEIMNQMNHPGIPKCYGYFETEAQTCIVLEYIENKNLRTILDEQERFLSEPDVIDWAVQLCDLLTYLHHLEPKPIVFRDLKPANILLDPRGHIFLTDFAIAIGYQAGQEQSLIGTEGYASPEQYWGYADARSDIYTFGVTLHHLLTRRNPRHEKLFSHHEVTPRSLNPAISEGMDAVIMRAVALHPEARFQTAEEMRQALLSCTGNA